MIRQGVCRQTLGLSIPSLILCGAIIPERSCSRCLRDQIKVLSVAVRLLPDTQVRSLTNFRSSARQRVLAIEIQRAPLSAAQRFVKRSMDIFAGALALAFFLPLMVLTAIAIKLDGPGPVIFRQSRKGFNGKEFLIFKFRTMTVQENGPAVVQATRDDTRVTPLDGCCDRQVSTSCPRS
jgi:hypothetical protein